MYFPFPCSFLFTKELHTISQLLKNSISVLTFFVSSFQFYALIDGGHSPIEFTKELYIGTVPMCRREMQSCIAGLYNQPYYGDIGHGNGNGGLSENVFAGTRASQMSLAAIVSVGGARPPPNPSAPPGVLDDTTTSPGDVVPQIEDEEEIVISGIGLSPTKKKNDEILVREEILVGKSPPVSPPPTISLNPDPVTSPPEITLNNENYQDWERPPPYAPDHMDADISSPAARLIDSEYHRPEATNPDMKLLGVGSGNGSNGGSTLGQ